MDGHRVCMHCLPATALHDGAALHRSASPKLSIALACAQPAFQLRSGAAADICAFVAFSFICSMCNAEWLRCSGSGGPAAQAWSECQLVLLTAAADAAHPGQLHLLTDVFSRLFRCGAAPDLGKCNHCCLHPHMQLLIQWLQA